MDLTANKKPEPFLTLSTKGLNGWFMASCPEFEVSTCGSNQASVISELRNMIIRNAKVYLARNKGAESSDDAMIEWSRLVSEHQDNISILFKDSYRK